MRAIHLLLSVLCCPRFECGKKSLGLGRLEPGPSRRPASTKMHHVGARAGARCLQHHLDHWTWQQHHPKKRESRAWSPTRVLADRTMHRVVDKQATWKLHKVHWCAPASMCRTRRALAKSGPACQLMPLGRRLHLAGAQVMTPFTSPLKQGSGELRACTQHHSGLIGWGGE